MTTVLTGDDSFALKQALGEMVDKFVKQHGELSVERIDAEESEAEQIFDAITGSSLLSPDKMVVVRGVSKHKDLLEKLATDKELVPETTSLVLIDSKLDKRAKYYKALKKTADVREFSTASTNDMPSWAVQYAKDQSAMLNRSDAVYLIESVGTNRSLLANEIDKLATYDANITRQAIDDLCEPLPQSSVFQLLDAAFGGNKDKAWRLYDDQRAQRVEPLAMMGMIIWQLHAIALAFAAGSRSMDEVAREAKMSPFVLKKSQALARRLDKTALRKLMHRALDLEAKLKSTAVDADEAMRYFLYDLAI